MPLSSENARLIKNNLDYILIPFYIWCIFYLPGMLFVYVLPLFELDNFLLRQVSYIIYSLFFHIPYGLYIDKIDREKKISHINQKITELRNEIHSS